MREMVAYVKDKQRLFAHQGMADRLSTLEKLGPLDNMRTFWDFDGRITAPLHGYADARITTAAPPAATSSARSKHRR